jgi:4,5:9,10-diseco-3-hydroxy-5,9,17-trioxoandrosta-1(10),2-diene-4-oate hydrolase
MNLRRYVGVPEGSLDIVVDGVHMAVAHEGAGPPVVCVHAIGHGGGTTRPSRPASRAAFK